MRLIYWVPQAAGGNSNDPKAGSEKTLSAVEISVLIKIMACGHDLGPGSAVDLS